jgi:hypothetical protein
MALKMQAAAQHQDEQNKQTQEDSKAQLSLKH